MTLQFLLALATTLFTAQPLPTAVTFNSSSYLTGANTSQAVQCTWTGATVGVSDIVIQSSLDDVNWVQKSSGITTINTAAGSEIFSLNGTTSEPYYRVSLPFDAAATGTISCLYVRKAP